MSSISKSVQSSVASSFISASASGTERSISRRRSGASSADIIHNANNARMKELADKIGHLSDLANDMLSDLEDESERLYARMGKAETRLGRIRKKQSPLNHSDAHSNEEAATSVVLKAFKKLYEKCQDEPQFYLFADLGFDVMKSAHLSSPNLFEEQWVAEQEAIQEQALKRREERRQRRRASKRLPAQPFPDRRSSLIRNDSASILQRIKSWRDGKSSSGQLSRRPSKSQTSKKQSWTPELEQELGVQEIEEVEEIPPPPPEPYPEHDSPLAQDDQDEYTEEASPERSNRSVDKSIESEIAENYSSYGSIRNDPFDAGNDTDIPPPPPPPIDDDNEDYDDAANEGQTTLTPDARDNTPPSTPRIAPSPRNLLNEIQSGAQLRSIQVNKPEPTSKAVPPSSLLQQIKATQGQLRHIERQPPPPPRHPSYSAPFADSIARILERRAVIAYESDSDSGSGYHSSDDEW